MSKSKLAGLLLGILVVFNAVLIFNLPAQAFTKGEVKVYSGTLIKNPDPTYAYTLEGKNINIITGNQEYFDTLIGKSVDVKVEFTGNGGKFRIVYIIPTNSDSSTSNGISGSASGYLRIAPTESGFRYYLMDANADDAHILRRINVSASNKSTWDQYVNQKVKLKYIYTQKTNGSMRFWSATIAAF